MGVTFILTFVLNPFQKYRINVFYCIGNLMVNAFYFAHCNC